MKKHRFRVMTNVEFCHKHKYCSKGDTSICYWFMHGTASIEPYKASNGKYILVKVINDD